MSVSLTVLLWVCAAMASIATQARREGYVTKKWLTISIALMPVAWLSVLAVYISEGADELLWERKE